MSATSWTVGAAIDGLVAGLQARPGLNGLVVDGWPGNETPGLECVWVADAENEPNVAAFRGGSGRIAYTEVYDLDVFVEVLGPGKSAKDVRDRVVELSAEVEKYIAENTTLGNVPGVSKVRLSRQQLMQYPTDDGRGATVRITITISGRR